MSAILSALGVKIGSAILSALGVKIGSRIGPEGASGYVL